MNNIMIRRLIYTFKRQWGREISYVQVRDASVDDSTGIRTINRDVFQIPVVVLPISTARKFIQDIGYLAADKNFTYGGLNDFNKLTVIISACDFPKAFSPNLNGYLNYKGKRYEKVSIDDLFGEAYIMITQGVEGANPYARIDVRASSRLQLTGGATCELS